MNKLNKVSKYITLYDEYKELLTDIQKNVFEMYYFEDMSLSEISKITQTTRSSISNKLKITEEILDKFESKLKLGLKKEKLELIINSLNEIKDKKLIKELKEL